MITKDLSDEECKLILLKGRYGRLALSQNDQPYLVPMSYVYVNDRIYLHSRTKGKKIDFVSKNPCVCFQVESLDTNQWKSIIAYGKASLSSDLGSKKRMFDMFMEKDLQGHGGKQFSSEELDKMEMTIWEIKINQITGREGIW